MKILILFSGLAFVVMGFIISDIAGIGALLLFVGSWLVGKSLADILNKPTKGENKRV